MLVKAKLKLINQLKLKKYRDLHNMFLVEGTKNVIDFFGSNIKLIEIFATSSWVDDHQHDFKNVSITIVGNKDLKRITALSTASEVIAIFFKPVNVHEQVPDNSNLSIALDNISDPGNLGTIIRTADWFGINQIFCSENTVDVYNPKVVQATMGSLARVQVIYINLENLFKKLPQRFPVFGAVLNGTTLSEIDSSNKGVILIGSEAHGISENLYPYISHKVTIPRHASGTHGKPESLNASIATAIVCYALKT